MAKINAPRGTADTLPADAWKWQAVERIANTFAQPFAETTEWFDVEPIGLGGSAFDPVTIRKWLQFYLNRLYQPGDYVDTARNFALVMNDAAKMGVRVRAKAPAGASYKRPPRAPFATDPVRSRGRLHPEPDLLHRSWILAAE